MRDEGRLEVASSLAIKCLIVWEFGQALQKTDLAKTEMSKRMGPSRAVVRRLQHETDLAVTLSTLSKGASALGPDIQFGLAR